MELLKTYGLFFAPLLFLAFLDQFIHIPNIFLPIGFFAGVYLVFKAADAKNKDNRFLSTKKCGSCGRYVPSISRSGERCPHCHAYWGAERTIYR